MHQIMLWYGKVVNHCYTAVSCSASHAIQGRPIVPQIWALNSYNTETIIPHVLIIPSLWVLVWSGIIINVIYYVTWCRWGGRSSQSLVQKWNAKDNTGAVRYANYSWFMHVWTGQFRGVIRYSCSTAWYVVVEQACSDELKWDFYDKHIIIYKPYPTM